jgi:hypothetical protein
VSLFGAETVVKGSSGPYDTMSFPGPGGAARTLSRSEFEKLPLLERVRLLSSGELRFFRGGEEVSSRDAIRGR